MLYQISKKYKENPTKNSIQETNLTIEDASFVLDLNESLWLKHGGTVLSKSETELVCEESDSSETISWKIMQQD